MKKPRRWLRIALWSCIGVIALTATLFAWIVGTTSGARFALRRAIAVTEGRLEIADVRGSLARRLTLDRVSWKDEGVEARVARIDLDFAVLDLLRKQLHITALNLEDTRLVLNTVTARPQPPEQAPISLAAPLTIRLDAFHAAGGSIVKNGETLLQLDTVDLGASWTAQGIGLKDFKLRAPAGEVDVNAQIGAAVGFPGGSDARFRWRFAERSVAGNVRTRSDGARVQVGVTLSEPTALKFDLDLAARDRHDWILALDVPPFDPKRVLPDTTLTALALSLKGRGDAGQGSVNATLDVNAHRVLLDPLRFAYADQHLRLDPLTLHAADAPGQLSAQGDIDLSVQPPLAKLALNWDGVELPADLAGQPLHSHGELQVDGSTEHYTAKGSLALGPPQRLADIRLDLDGTPKAIALKKLELVQPQGGFDASGEIALDPAVAWTLHAKAQRFDPGAFVASWPGMLNFDLATAGSLAPELQGSLKLERLDGTLRQRPLAGNADLHLTPGHVIDGTLALASGQSNLAITGRGGSGDTDADIGFTLASLGDLLPDAQGALQGKVSLKGVWPALAAKAHVTGTKLGFGDHRIATLTLDADVKDTHAPSGQLALQAQQLTLGSLAFATLDLHGDGDEAAHSLQLSAKGEPLNLDATLRGSRDAKGWNGALSALTLAVKNQGEWTLEKPAALSLQGENATLGELCLASNGPRLCAQGRSAGDGSAEGRYRIEQLPLAMIAALAAPDAPLKLVGTLEGDGTITRNASGALNGSANLHSRNGSVSYPDTATTPLLGYDDFALDARFTPQATQATLHAALSDGGRLEGKVAASGAQQALSGEAALSLRSLAFVELFTSELSAVKGQLDSKLAIGGSVAQPAFDGSLTLADFAAEVPTAGLTLHDGRIAVTSRGARAFAIDGTLASGEGTVQLRGEGGLDADAPLALTLSGSDFLAADIPAARVVVGPQLTIRREQDGLHIGGELAIPSTKVDFSKLPGGGAAKASPDVVVTDAAEVKRNEPAPVFADVTVKLGDAVKLKGFGLDGALAGQLAVIERPGKQTTGRGEIRVSGTYKAYGQDLKIQTGRLQFAGTAIDNPGLDLRAVRELKDVTAGLRVQGTAQVPVLTVFSEPPLEQAEALSYLVTGKSLASLKSGEGDMVGTAARALGSATGDLLAKSVGARLGVDAGVSDNAALGGAAFTVGKFLSPKLYLSYGVGLFVPGEVITLRYLLSRRWNLEAQSATNDNRAGLNYRYEK